MKNILRCYDCGKKIGYDVLTDVGMGIPMVTDSFITDKGAMRQLRYADTRKKAKFWVCGECAKKGE